MRELKEETGLKGKIKRLIGVYFQKITGYGSLLVIGYGVSLSKYNFSLNDELKDARFSGKKDLPVIPFSSHRRIIRGAFKDI